MDTKNPKGVFSYLASALDTHLGLVASAVLVMFTSLRLVLVARGDTSTAVALMQHAGTANVVIGLLVSVMPVLILTVALCLDYLQAPQALVRPLILVGVLLYPIIKVLFIGLLLAATTVVLLAWETVKIYRSDLDDVGESSGDDNAESEPRQMQRWVFLVSLVGLAFPMLVTDTPWLPAEMVTIHGHDEPVTGYVLMANDQQTSILRDEDRTILTYRESWQERTICRMDNGQPLQDWRWLQGSLIDLVFVVGGDSPSYPDCPDS